MCRGSSSEGLHGAITCYRARGRLAAFLLDFASAAPRMPTHMPSPYQFTYFGGLDASLSFSNRPDGRSCLEASFRLACYGGCRRLLDITGRAKIVFSGMFNAGAKLPLTGKLVIEKEGKLKKLVNEVEHITFSGKRAVA